MPRRKKKASRGKYCRERLEDPRRFDKRSFRTKTVRKGRTPTKIVVGCPKGEWMPRAKRCKVGTVAQAILHPLSRCPKGKTEMKRQARRGPSVFGWLSSIGGTGCVFCGVEGLFGSR